MSVVNQTLDQVEKKNWYLLYSTEKSALQKYIRRGMAERAMYWADKLVRMSPTVFWRRAKIIVVEDCGQSETICAVFAMEKEFNSLKAEHDDGNRRRLALCAAKVMAESLKDRRCDEMLEVLQEADKGNDRCRNYLEEISKIDEFVLDMHTPEGRRLKRGQDYWVRVSSETVNKSEKYSEWRGRWQTMMDGYL